MSELSFLSVTEASHLIDAGEISPVDLVTALLDQLEQRDALYNSHITVCRDSALRTAQSAERAIHRGERRGPLHGIPVSHKDICWTAGVRTTAHSKSMLDFVPDEDATFIGRLAERGMILMGKTNTTEFACGDMLEFGYTPNPWNLSRYAGSSSSGSASALAAGLAIATTGTDTGGSIRFPASVCGIVGVKPTYGRVSRHGVVPLSWTMDNVGPMTRTVADAALMLEAMSGHDPRDPGTADEPIPDFGAELTPRLDGLVLGVPEQHFFDDLEPGVDAGHHPGQGRGLLPARRPPTGARARLRNQSAPADRRRGLLHRNRLPAGAAAAHPVEPGAGGSLLEGRRPHHPHPPVHGLPPLGPDARSLAPRHQLGHPALQPVGPPRHDRAVRLR
jgi:aspartyl-tRNA(Asn)/glutamyl-tRNA(Gln) amidotransferase subunit A